MTGTDVVVFRPRNLLIWASVLSVVLVVASFIGWFALPVNLRAQFTMFQILTLLFFIAIMIGMMMGLGLCIVRADRTGLFIRNGLVQSRLGWNEIADFRYRHGDPWAYVLLDEGDDPRRRQLIAIQTTDGARAMEAVQRLRSMLAEYRRSQP